MSPSLHWFVQETAKRKVRRALAIYLGAALPAIGIANLLESRYAIPPVWFDRFLVLLAVGLLFTGTVAWFHGGHGAQRLRSRELAVYAVLLLAGITGVFVVPSSRVPSRPSRSTADKSIAVLPFKNFSEGKDDEYFSNGIMEDILTNLSRIGDLRVISRTTMMRYRESTKSLQEIGRELNVGAVLEGSVRRAGERVRIVGQLIDAKTDEHLWAETYDRDLRDIFEIQSDVARRIAQALEAVLSPREHDRLGKVPTSNIEAYALYLRGREHYNRYTREENESAIALFLEALSLDSLYAPAYAGLGDAYSQRVQRYGYTMNWLDSSLAKSRRALELDDGLAEAHKSLALAYDNNGWMRRAREEYDRAISLDPNFVTAIRNVGLLEYRTGSFAQALAMAQRSILLAPDHVMGYVQAGMALQAVGEDSAAISLYEKARNLNPRHPVPLLGIGWLFLAAGKGPQARIVVDTLLQLAPGFEPGLELSICINMVAGDLRSALRTYEEGGSPTSSRGGFLLNAAGRKAESQRVLQETVARTGRFVEAGDESPTPRVEAAIALELLGKRAEALDWFRKAIDAGWREVRWARQDPLLAGLRGDLAFQQLLAEADHRLEPERKTILKGDEETGNRRL
jgi:TolB-like protein/Tfp pilus assembly protein PilF